MRLQEVYGRFEYDGEKIYGKVEGDGFWPLDMAPWLGGKINGELTKIADVKVLHPSEPKVILGLGGAYKNAWKDSEPYSTVRWFLKPPSSAAGTEDTVFMPESVDEIEVEVELTIVIGKTIKNASESEAEKAIFGYTIANDMVASVNSYHEIQGESSEQLEPLLGPGLKIGDRFAPFGPFIHTNFDWKSRGRKVIVVDEKGNEKFNSISNTSDMVYSPQKTVSDLSKVLTLSPGDIVMTGTDRSYPVVSGDVVSVEIDGLGKLINTID